MSIDRIQWDPALLAGLYQGVGLVPGPGRAGATLSAGRPSIQPAASLEIWFASPAGRAAGEPEKQFLGKLTEACRLRADEVRLRPFDPAQPLSLRSDASRAIVFGGDQAGPAGLADFERWSDPATQWLKAPALPLVLESGDAGLARKKQLWASLKMLFGLP